MRTVLFAVQPTGCGKVYRSLAVAESLQDLFPVIAPRFLSGGDAAELLAGQARFPVEALLDPAAGPGAWSQVLSQATRQHRPDMVVLDGLLECAAGLRGLTRQVTLFTDHLGEHARGWLGRVRAALMRRSAVASSQLRFYVGEPSYLESPELRVWARRHFRFSGPISGLARLQVGDCATLRDDLGVGSQPLVVLVGGGLPADARARLGEMAHVVEAGAGGALRPELYRVLAVADAAIIPPRRTLLFECAGLGLPTVCRAGDALDGRYFAARHGVQRVGANGRDDLAGRIRELLARGPRPHDFPDAREQRRNAEFAADLMAEALGRRRPATPPPTP